MITALLGDVRYVIRNTLSKLLLFFILFSLLSSLFITSAFAQTPNELSVNRKEEIVDTKTQNQLPPTSYGAAASSAYQLSTSYSPQSPHFASQAIYNFSHAINCILIGQSAIAPCLEYKLVKDATGMVKSVPYLSQTNTSNGLLGMSFSMIGEVISTPPIHSSLFLANLGEQIGIKSANAQVSGSGSGVLAPIFKLWEVSRNISYLVMILIFVFVGLMVMFRQKLNPQTVVSVQLALPGLVIGLVMITFSYFLASLISDIAFVGTNVVGYYFSLAQGSTKDPPQLPLMTTKGAGWQNALQPEKPAEANVINLFAKFSGVIQSEHITPILESIWDDLDDPKKNWCCNPFDSKIDPRSALELLSTFMVFQLFSPINSAFSGGGTLINMGATLINGNNSINTLSFALGFIAAIILIYSMFKLLLRLIQSLLSIIFLTIAAPFYFLATSLPGKQSLLPNWFFNMLCNVLAFPAIFGVFYFVAFILGSGNPANNLFQINTGSGSIAGTSTFPLLGGISFDFLNRLIAFGALVASPSIPDIICRAVGKPNQLGALAAGAVGGAIASGQKYQGQAQSGIGGLGQGVGGLTDTLGYQNVNGAWRQSKASAYSKPGSIAAIGATAYAAHQWWKGDRDLFGRNLRTGKPVAAKTPPTDKDPVRTS